MELLTFYVGDREFGVELDRVGEIIPPPPVTRVPGTAPALVGVAPLRGEPIPVLDGGLRLSGTPIARSGRTPVVVLQAQRDGQPLRFGFVVHAAGRKLEVDRLMPLDVAHARMVAADACVGFAESEGALIVVLDVDRLLDLPDGPALPAAHHLGEARPARPRPELEPVAEAPPRAVADLPAPSGESTPALPPPVAPSAQRIHVSRSLQAPHRPSQRSSAPRSPSRARPPHAPAYRTAPTPLGTFAQPSVTALAARHAADATPPCPAPAPATEPSRSLAPGPGTSPATVPAPPAPGPRRHGLPAGVAIAALSLLAVAGLFALRGQDSPSGSTSARSRASAATSEPAPPPSAPVTQPLALPSTELPVATTPATLPATAAVPAPSAPASPRPTQPAPPQRRSPLPPSMVVTPTTPACEIHDVKKGDTLWWISARKLGDPKRWPELFGENRGVIVDPDVIAVHDQIRIPGACASRTEH